MTDASRTIRVGMAQLLVVPGRPDDNLARARAAVAEAAQAGCDVVVLPECLDLGWTHESARELAEPIPGPRVDVLAAAAREHGVLVAAGLTERAGDRVHNSAVLLSATGELLLHHRKIHELDFARALYTTGSSLAVADTPLGRIGLDICADNSAATTGIGHALGLMGAEVLLSPSAWAVPPDHDNHVDPYGAEWEAPYRELATAHDMPVVGVSNVGPVVGGEWDGWRCIGASLAVGRDGETIRQGTYGEAAAELLVVDVELRPRTGAATGSTADSPAA
ncbi:carbon-nitrogen hydrolase family protein [Cellulomonas sp. JZ18]|uniref:carbon-nitrogen hydrolase family protein n=1 Tax=Cellulomonas sp. JZ18 TaxID=2654191 RepID=UPI0012D37ED2|nr:carbon-nitrogen hydrolase family protein [Cellulomonas sp. JZ18]QGQ20518.1 carbon-nitrogen hydrolase family protein [Cellulomonas sp. JZ18]